MKYNKIHNPKHPLAKGKGGVPEHRAILYAKIGPGPHPCHWCGKEVSWFPVVSGIRQRGTLDADHVDRDTRNNRPDNLVPSCHRCNVSRSPDQRVKTYRPHAEIQEAALARLRQTFTCPQCSGTFTGRDRKYCTPACRSEAQKTTIRQERKDRYYETHPRKRQTFGRIGEGEQFHVRPNGTRVRMVTYTCDGCGTSYQTYQRIPEGRRRYCTQQCAKTSQRSPSSPRSRY
jgi:hypothetical protein